MAFALELGGIGDPNVRRALERISERLGAPPRLPAFTTALRPPAAALGVGAAVYDTTLLVPVWSDGTSWRNATGTVV